MGLAQTPFNRPIPNIIPGGGALAYREAFLTGIAPDKKMNVAQWADTHRVLPKKGSAEPGRYRTSRTPYLREIMEKLSPNDPTEEVVLMKCTQVGGSEGGNNWVGCVIHLFPGPFLYVQKTVDVAKKYSKQRIAPMIDSTDVLKERIRPPRSRDSGNTLDLKEFPGGMLILTGANSSSGLRSFPIRYLFLDDLDAYPEDVDGEGEPTELAVERTNTFSRRKIFWCSTPTLKETSRIERKYEESDKRRFHVPCPHCNKKQHLKWSNLKFDVEIQGISWPDKVWYLCEHCAGIIEEHHKTWMLENGEWIAESPGEGKPAGYHLNALYSPLGWKSWKKCVRQFLNAHRKRNRNLLITFTNNVLAETWEEQGEQVQVETLKARREDYQGKVPDDVLVITAGVDVQADRFEVGFWGWGLDWEIWALDHVVVNGDPTKKETQAELVHQLERTFETQAGIEMNVVSAMVDTGYQTNTMYEFIGPLERKRILGCKGISKAGHAICSPTKSKKIPIRLHMIGVDAAKEFFLLGILKNETPGPSYCHIPFYGVQSKTPFDDEWLTQFTSEKQVTRMSKGFQTLTWVRKPSVRAEVLDCAVYAMAAFVNLKARMLVLAQKRKEAIAAIQEYKESENKDSKPQPRKPARRKRPGFVQGWRR